MERAGRTVGPLATARGSLRCFKPNVADAREAKEPCSDDDSIPEIDAWTGVYRVGTVKPTTGHPRTTVREP